MKRQVRTLLLFCLIAPSACMAIIGDGKIAIAGDISQTGSSASRGLQQCLSDYLIYQHDHPTDDYYHGILEIESKDAIPDKYYISLYFADTKFGKRNLKSAIDQKLQINCTNMAPNIANENRPNFLGQAGSWPADRPIIFKTTCSLSKPYKKSNNFLIIYSCNTITMRPQPKNIQLGADATKFDRHFTQSCQTTIINTNCAGWALLVKHFSNRRPVNLKRILVDCLQRNNKLRHCERERAKPDYLGPC